MRPFLSFCCALGILTTTLSSTRAAELAKPVAQPPLLQIALLLDTSNSMDGLISQAKTQLWKIVNELALARRNGLPPQLRVALYEYGNNRLLAEHGFVRQVIPLTDDLDRVSDELFRLTTSGGQEYCGRVILDATTQLEWSDDADYKAIIIAGNEPFTQGDVDYKNACAEAITRGILVNTVFCGPSPDGVVGGWKDGALLSDGSYMNIDQNEALVHIAAPQDDAIARLGVALNSTYLAYGAVGLARQELQVLQDSNAIEAQNGAAVQRATCKVSPLYKNAVWDLVDALEDGTVKLEAIKKEDLPKELQALSIEKRQALIAQKKTERARLKKEIQSLAAERDKFVAGEREKHRAAGAAETFDTALIRTLREQCSTKNLQFPEPTVELENDPGH
jgi:hypothetical protein